MNLVIIDFIKNKAMRNNILCMIAILLMLVSCRESEKLMYGDFSGIHIKLPVEDTTVILRRDTLIYSFAFEKPELKQKTINIPVEIEGFRVNKDRKFKVEVLNEGTTAVEDVNYIKLQEYYTVKANEGIANIPITFNRSLDIREKPVLFSLRLSRSDDFEIGINHKQKIVLSVSDILEEPVWWEGWKFFFGDYHRIKYQEWIKIKGGKGELDVIDMRPYMIPYRYPRECVQIMELRLYFEKNPRYELEHLNDPNNLGRRLIVPCPL